MTRHRAAAVSAALVLAGLGGFAAASAAQSPGPRQPAPVERVQRFYLAGPTADYSGDSGGIGTVSPLVWTQSSDEPATAVVEVSFQYRTRGQGPFVVDLGVREVDGKRTVVRPEELTLAPAPEGSTTTVRFLVPHLASGRTYQAQVGVNSVFPAHGVNRIGTRRMVLTVESSREQP